MALSTKTRPDPARFTRLRRPALPVAVACALVALTAASSAGAGRVSGPLVPSSGALMGAFVNPNNAKSMTLAQQEKLVLNFQTLIGRKLDIDMAYFKWGNDWWARKPAWDVARGIIPMIKYGADNTAPSLNKIVNGSDDAELRTLARGARSLGAPFLFCPMWEMNGHWAIWNGIYANDSGTFDGPAKFVQAWRHMHDIFVQEGATNAVWVWAPSRTDIPKQNWNHWLKYYPGDAYVDWVGMDGYNWGGAASWPQPWLSFEDLFSGIYQDFDGRKPIMVAETASTEKGGDKAQWMKDARDAIKARWPDIVAVVWFDSDKETNWRVDSSSASLAAYRLWATDPYYNVHGTTPYPSSRLLPTITGRPKVGNTLAGANGTWANAPTSFTYRWYRCNVNGGRCQPISGATGLSYPPALADVGYTLRLYVAARNASGSRAAWSDPTGIVAARAPSAPAPVINPTLLGSYEQGAAVDGSRGSWKGAPTTYTYAWFRCNASASNCVPLAGQTSVTHVLSSADAGHRVRLRVTATNAAGSKFTSVTSLLVYGLAPKATKAPSIAGSAVKGATLTASAGTWSGATKAYLYRWRRCGPTGARCITIAGATASTYVPTAADSGSALRVDVVATNAWGSTLRESAPTAAIP